MPGLQNFAVDTMVETYVTSSIKQELSGWKLGQTKRVDWERRKRFVRFCAMKLETPNSTHCFL